MNPPALFKTLAALALLPAFSAAAPAQPCANVGGKIGGSVTITVTGDCVINDRAVIAEGNVTIKSAGKTPRTITRGIGGPLITVKYGAALTLENIVIDGDKTNAPPADESPLVHVEPAAKLIMNDGAVLQNNTARNGGGVMVGNGGTLTMNGGKISGSTAEIGGGVFMKHGARFHMTGGAITGNTANDFGGGVFVNDAGSVTMSGGNITGNASGRVGGGVAVWGGVFTLIGGAICENSAPEGGSVYVYESAKFNNGPGETCPADNVPAHKAKKAASADLSPATGSFTAGPNPVSKYAEKITFFYSGGQISKGELTVFEESGKVVTKIKLRRGDRPRSPAADDKAKHPAGEWNLKDRKGRTVTEGTYLVKGTITVNGKKEKVSVTLGVR
ncbi:MAG: hypothetical protein FWB85_02930 [Chitinispirillia bacterium]|nr:hypothetical protein [Chitinispirillia bacterium]